MKKTISLVLAFVMSACLVIPVSAEERETSDATVTLRAVEIQNELDYASEMLGGPCRLKEEKIQRIGSFIVENRLYVLSEPTTTESLASIGECGGVSSQTWRMWGNDWWDTKVLFSAHFSYNGDNAICDKSSGYFWAVDCVINRNFNEEFYYTDTSILNSKAKARCDYAMSGTNINDPPSIAGSLSVTCSKDGVVGYENKGPSVY